MTAPMKSRVTAGNGPSLEITTHAHHSKPPTKWRRVLTALAAGGSYNRFDAERQLSDHCLHSTIARIQGKGVTVDRRDEVVPGYASIPTHVTRYWLAPASRERAVELLGAEVDGHAVA